MIADFAISFGAAFGVVMAALILKVCFMVFEEMWRDNRRDFCDMGKMVFWWCFGVAVVITAIKGVV